MPIRLRMLIWICLATALWAFGFGVQSQVASHWLKAAGENNTAIGWNHGAYYLGLALASLATPPLVRRLGARSVAATGMMLSGVFQLLFPWGGGLAGWFALRLAGGMAGALSIIPLEAQISEGAPPGQRSRFFACYGLAFTLGGAIGIWAGLSWYEGQQLFPFLVGGLMPVLGGAGLFLLLPPSPPAPQASTATFLPWRTNLLSLGTAWFQGFLEGGLLAFLSLFLLTVGYSQDAAGVLMGLTMVGVILFQVPVAWLADWCGRRTVLLSCYAVVLTGLALIPWQTGWLELAIVLFLVGACAGAMYPLGLAMLGENLPEAQAPRAYAWYLTLECVGSQLGAPMMGWARDVWGDAAMFGVGLIAGCAVLGVAFLGRTGTPREPTGENAETPCLESSSVRQSVA